MVKPRSQRRLAFKAFVFVFLLAGAECARLNQQATLSSAHRELTGMAQKIDSHMLAKMQSHGSHRWPWFGGSDVCLDRSGKTDLVKRYHYKAERLRNLSASLNGSTGKITFTVMRQWFQLQARIKRFGSCMDMIERDTAPPDLQKSMLLGSDRLQDVVLGGPLKSMSSLLTEAKLFPTSGGCKFDPSRLDLIAAVNSTDPETLLMHQLYGSLCNKTAVESYNQMLKRFPRQVVSITHTSLGNFLRLRNSTADALSEIEAARSTGDEGTEQAKKAVLQQLKDTRASLRQQLDELSKEAEQEEQDIQTNVKTGQGQDMGASLSAMLELHDSSHRSRQGREVSQEVGEGFMKWIVKYILTSILIMIIVLVIVCLIWWTGGALGIAGMSMPANAFTAAWFGQNFGGLFGGLYGQAILR